LPSLANPERDWQDAALLLGLAADLVASLEQLGNRHLEYLHRLGPLLEGLTLDGRT
jgi:hypothetical protein